MASLAAVVAKVAVDAGAPDGILTAARVLALGLTGLAVLWGQARLDFGRAMLLGLAVLLLPTVYGDVGGDGIQAFVVARSLLFDRDLDLANDYAGLGAPMVATAAGRATSHLPVGLALLWMPALLLAHLGTALAREAGAALAADGFSAPYRSAATAATYVYGVTALLLLETAVRRRHGRAAALLAALAVFLATPLHFYLTANPAMAHGVSVFAASLFVVFWLHVRQGRAESPRAWAMVGLLGALMTLVRLQDAVLLLLPGGDLLLRRPPRWTRSLAALAGAAALLGSLQLLAWLRLFGSGFLSAVLGFNLVGGTEPEVAGLLFSPRHGLFYWTPLYVLCVLGWFLWARRDRTAALLVGAGFAASVLVNASMQDWWGAEAFGQRRLLGLTPLFALGLGEVLGAVAGAARVLAGTALLLLAAWTWSFEGIYNSGVVAPRDQAITYGQLAHAQAEDARRKLLRAHGRLPPRLWAALWSAAGGSWIDEPPLGGRIDLGAEPDALPFLVSRGWYDPQQEEGATLRRSRGGASFLRVPVRRPERHEVVLRLRPELPDLPLSVTVEVNREPVGAVEVGPGWAEYRLEVPPRVLRTGLNDLGLVYSATPRAARPDHRGRNAAVAVDWIVLRPVP